MDLTEMRKTAEAYRAACARTLFAVNQAITNATEQVRMQTAQRYRQAEEQARLLQNQDDGILRAAEYLLIGEIRELKSARDVAIPYILPFLGKAHICIVDDGASAQHLSRNLVMDALMQTAPAQLEVTVYNPKLVSDFSCFTGLENFKILYQKSDLQQLLTALASKKAETDKLLKGRYATLLDLRSAANQAVGTLQLVVINDSSWAETQASYEEMTRIAAQGMQAGIAFIFLLGEVECERLCAAVPDVNVLTQMRTGWQCSLHPNLMITPKEYSISEMDDLLTQYAEKAKKSAANPIPFEQIEQKRDSWGETTRDGIEIHLGRRALDTVSICMDDQHVHALITGATGMGKSNLLQVMIHSMCSRYSPRELALYLLDFKDGVTFAPYKASNQREWLPQARVLGLESARDFGVAVMEYLETERIRRMCEIREGGAKEIRDYRAKYPSAEMPRILLLIDEYQILFGEDDALGHSAVELLIRLLNLGRAAGIHIMMASQGVVRKGAMLSKAEDVYKATAVRIALKNTAEESYAILMQGDDSAARIRLKGEAILNTNYGYSAGEGRTDNTSFVIAYADSEKMRQLRRDWCTRPEAKGCLPKAFGVKDCFQLSDAIPTIHQWREAVQMGKMKPILVCGMKISIERELQAISMSDDAGKHVAIIGSGDADRVSPKIPPTNYAIGTLENMAISLALQHPEGDARFTFVNGLPNATAADNGIPLWLQTMERFGFPVEVVSAEEAPQFFVDTAKEMQQRTSAQGAHYIIAMGLDRCTGMNEKLASKEPEQKPSGMFAMPELFSTSSTGQTGMEAFREILKEGSVRGIHILAWWMSATVYNKYSEWGVGNSIHTKILMRMDIETARNILGVGISWGSISNRELFHDTDAGDSCVLMPIVPCNPQSIGKLEAEMWL